MAFKFFFWLYSTLGHVFYDIYSNVLSQKKHCIRFILSPKIYKINIQ